MTVTNISTSSFTPWPNPHKNDSEGLPNTETAEKDLRIPEMVEANATNQNEISLDSLVLKPSPVSLEERMDQVISFEEMKNLLSMMAKTSKSNSVKKNFHLIDVKR